MEQLGSNQSQISLRDDTLAFRVAVPCLEMLNLLFLTMGCLGMYNGIEIQHPMYMVLFNNLIQALLSTVTNLILFLFLPFDKLIQVCHSKFSLFV
jgi:hypothetical protein